MKIYTKTGDKGTTGLYGGKRVSKHDLRVQAYGTVDECNASIGVARAHISEDISEDAAIAGMLESIQNTLFDVGADLATPTGSQYRDNIVPIDADDVAVLEGYIDHFDTVLEPLRAFILPAGTIAAAQLHVARTVARRAEREVVMLAEQEELNPALQMYLNRLSDALFVLARAINQAQAGDESKWQVKGRKPSS